jgi:hypothetical protein
MLCILGALDAGYRPSAIFLADDPDGVCETVERFAVEGSA